MPTMKILTGAEWAESNPIQQALLGRLHRGEITFDWNGHQISRVTKPVVPPAYTWEFRRDFGGEENVVEDLQLSTNDFRPLKTGRGPLPVGWRSSCHQCGKQLQWALDGDVLKVVGRCKYPKGYPALDGAIPVPSGVLVFANYFDFLPVAPSGEGRGMPGEAAEFRHYIKHQAVVAYCGNTCPSIKKKDNKLIVCRYEYRGHKGFRRVGGVVTDAWQWSAGDLGLMEKKNGGPLTGDYYTKVKVRPGVYKITQLFYQINRETEEKKKPFAVIERI